MNIDLHIHSQYSTDGEHAIKEILLACKQRDITTIAITDHNTVQGVKEAMDLCGQMGIEVIPGIEIDCCFNSLDLHVLGYFIDYENNDFADLQREYETKQQSVFAQRLDKLKALGIQVNEAKVLKRSKGKIPSDELIAEVVLEDPRNFDLEILKPFRSGGERSDNPYLNFYWDICSQGKVAYVPMKFRSLEDIIHLIKSNHGVPIIAHPGQNLKANLALIDPILQAGIEGIEVFSSYHSPQQEQFFYAKSKANNLAITCGSDFHGKNKPTIALGCVSVNYGEKVEEIVARLQALMGQS